MLSDSTLYMLACSIVQQQTYMYNTSPWFGTRRLSTLPAGESVVALHLHCTLVCPNHVFKRIILVFLSPLEPLNFVDVTDQLAICATPKSPP